MGTLDSGHLRRGTDPPQAAVLPDWPARTIAPMPFVPSEIRRALIALVREHPGRLLQHECVALLAGAAAPPAIRRDPRYGTFAEAGKGAIQRTLRVLLLEGELALGRGERLELGCGSDRRRFGAPGHVVGR